MRSGRSGAWLVRSSRDGAARKAERVGARAGGWFSSSGAGRKRRVARPRLWLSACAALATLGAAIAGCGSSTPSGSSSTAVLKLGAILNLSGSAAFLETPALQGLQYAVSQINRTGFVVNGKTYKIDLIVGHDAAGNPTTAVQDARTLISDGVQFLYAPVSSGASDVLPIASAAKVMMLTASSTIYPDLGPKYPLLFRVSVDDAYRGRIETQYVKSVLPNAKTLAIMETEGTEGQVIIQNAELEYDQIGVKTVKSILYPEGTSDFTSYMTQIAAAHPSLFELSLASPDNLTELSEGIKLNAAANYLVGLPPSVIPTYVPNSFPGRLLELNPGDQFYVFTTAKTRAFANGLKSFLHGKLPEFVQYAPFYYDSTFMLVKAMEAAGTVSDAAAVAKKFKSMTYDGMYGQITYDGGYKTHYPVDDCVYYKATFSCENVNINAQGKLIVLGKASEKIG
jgi:branched-chain amino acid transport system substrate-binding protein